MQHRKFTRAESIFIAVAALSLLLSLLLIGVSAQQIPAWAPNTFYTVGTRVSYQSSVYECRQSHTSLVGWEPPIVLALWLPVTGDGGGGQDTQAPAVPGNLRVTATTSTSVSLAWDAASDNVGVTGYNVFRNTALAGTSATTGFTVSGLTAGTTYSFSVKAKDAAGNISQNSNSVMATTTNEQPPPPPPPAGRRVVGYFAQWGIYGRQYFVKNVDTSGSAARLTHINYAFANIRNSRPLVGVTQQGMGDAWADYVRSTPAGESVDGVGDMWNTPLRGNWGQLKKLKAKYPHLKVLISLGGWSWSGGFSDAALPQNRQAFVAECIRVFIDGDLPQVDNAGGPGALAAVFDGIDLDWEYPIGMCVGQPGCMSRPEDPQNFVELVAEFRRQLDIKGAQTGRRFELTAAVAAGIDKIEKMVISPLVPNLDFISVMTFDFFGGFDATGPTAFQSALFAWSGMPSNPPLNNYYSDFAIQQYRSRGFPANKILLTVPFYGRGWTGVTNTNNGLNQPAQGPAPGDFPEEPGVKSYKNLKLLGYPAFRNSEAQAYWIFNGSTFWSFDDPISLINKANYVKTQGLGGMMFWNLTDDTVNGELINAISNGLR
jgi:chitinase